MFNPEGVDKTIKEYPPTLLQWWEYLSQLNKWLKLVKNLKMEKVEIKMVLTNLMPNSLAKYADENIYS